MDKDPFERASTGLPSTSFSTADPHRGRISGDESRHDPLQRRPARRSRPNSRRDRRVLALLACRQALRARSLVLGQGRGAGGDEEDPLHGRARSSKDTHHEPRRRTVREGAPWLGEHLVINSSPLIFLARIGSLELLREVAHTVWVPERVFSQVVDDAPEKPGAAQVRAADWLQLRRPRSDILEDVAQFLDPGEADTVAIAHEIESSVVVLDDNGGAGAGAESSRRTSRIRPVGRFGLRARVRGVPRPAPGSGPPARPRCTARRPRCECRRGRSAGPPAPNSRARPPRSPAEAPAACR